MSLSQTEKKSQFHTDSRTLSVTRTSRQKCSTDRTVGIRKLITDDCDVSDRSSTALLEFRFSVTDTQNTKNCLLQISVIIPIIAKTTAVLQ